MLAAIFKQGSTFQSEVVVLHIWEMLGKVGVMKAERRRKKTVQKTDFEKNVSALRSKERNLSPQSPVSPIKHRP